MARKKKNKVVEELEAVTEVLVEEEPVIVESMPVEEPVVINDEMPAVEDIVLEHSHEDREPLDKHFMILKSDLGYLPKVGDVVKYKGYNCKVVRVKLNKIFLCRED